MKIFRTVVTLLLLCFCCLPPTQVEAATNDALTMGVFPRRNAKVTVKLFTPLAQHLSDQLGRDVKLETTKDFDSFWVGIKSQRYDIVHFNQYHYVKAHKEYGYNVIVKNMEFGIPSLSGALFVRKDSGINTVKDLKGKKVVFGGGADAYIAHITIKHLLNQEGLKSGDYQEEFARNPPNAIFATFYKQADAGGAGNIGIKLPMVKSKINPDELKMLVESEQQIHLPWAVKGSMSSGLSKKIQQLMAGLKESEKGQSVLKSAKLNAMAPVQDTDFDQVRKIVFQVLGEQY